MLVGLALITSGSIYADGVSHFHQPEINQFDVAILTQHDIVQFRAPVHIFRVVDAKMIYTR